MTDEEQALYEEQQRIREELRPFRQPYPAGNAPEFTTKQLEHANALRERDKQIELKLEEIQRRTTR